MLTKTFKQLNKKDVSLVGGKGASLGEMTQAEISVPLGFVVLVEAFDRFLEETDLVQEIAACLAKINYKDINSVDRASNEIRDLFHDALMPKDLEKEFLREFEKLKAKYVAVRSSATAEDSAVASWAGELETYLNTTKQTLNKNIKKCWSSLFTSRALFYGFEKGVVKIDHQRKIRARTCKKLLDCYPVSVAVVIQKMIQSEIAGVCFTVHPVTKDKNQMVIEAAWGLGEILVSGQITPDTYVVEKPLPLSLRGAEHSMLFECSATKQSRTTSDKAWDSSPPTKILWGAQNDKIDADFKILDINVNPQEKMIVRSKAGNKIIKVPKSKQSKQKLSVQQIIELAKLAIQIESHYQSPQDIEWAYKNNKFYIVQSRPITTL